MSPSSVATTCFKLSLQVRRSFSGVCWVVFYYEYYSILLCFYATAICDAWNSLEFSGIFGWPEVPVRSQRHFGRWQRIPSTAAECFVELPWLQPLGRRHGDGCQKDQKHKQIATVGYSVAKSKIDRDLWSMDWFAMIPFSFLDIWNFYCSFGLLHFAAFK